MRKQETGWHKSAVLMAITFIGKSSISYFILRICFQKIIATSQSGNPTGSILVMFLISFQIEN